MRSLSKNQIDTPALLLDLDILEQNIAKMSCFMKDKKAKLRPHFKTAKCPAVSHKEINAGAKGITCAKLSEAEVLAATGIKDILIANQIVDENKIYRLAALARGDTKITVAADDIRNIKMLSEAAFCMGAVVHVLIEVNVGMNRCGVNSFEEVYNLAKEIKTSRGLVLEGLQAYEGHLSLLPDLDKRRHGVCEINTRLKKLMAELEQNGIHIREVSGGGTGTYDISGNDMVWTEIQAGSYTLMDKKYGRLGLGFGNALSVLATVIHKRPGAAVTDAGIKVCSNDGGEPSIKDYSGINAYLNEEHGILEDPEEKLAYMQKIEYIPGHCCTTVNLHERYYCIRNGRVECEWPILGRGMSR